MVRHHVAQRAGAFVVAAARFHPDRFGRRDLYVIDVVPIPQRLENAVREAKGEDVLNGLFAEVVVDPIDL